MKVSATLTIPHALPAEQPVAAPMPTLADMAAVQDTAKIITRQLNFFYGDHQALFDNDLEISKHKVTAIIGPSGCGKSTHIRIYNRIYRIFKDSGLQFLHLQS